MASSPFLEQTARPRRPKGRLWFCLRLCAAALAVLCLPGCAHIHWASDAGFDSSLSLAYEMGRVFDDFNKMEGAVCMGISGPHSRGHKRKAFKEATENCLLYLALNEGLAVQQDLDAIVDTQEEWDSFAATEIAGTADRIFNEAAARLEIVQARWYGDKIGAVVYARLPDAGALPPGLAEWKGAVPSPGDGRIYVEGVSRQRHSDPARAVEASAFDAARKLLEASGSNLMADCSLVEKTEESFKQDTYSIIGGKFKDFRILALRCGEDGRVHLLASARE